MLECWCNDEISNKEQEQNVNFQVFLDDPQAFTREKDNFHGQEVMYREFSDWYFWLPVGYFRKICG